MAQKNKSLVEENSDNEEKPEDLLENSLKDTERLEQEQKWDKICEFRNKVLEYVNNNSIPLCDFLNIEKIENFIISLR